MAKCTMDYRPGLIGTEIKVAAPKGVDRLEARQMALEAARSRYREPMLLAWLDKVRGEFSPAVECCGEDKPAWVIYAGNRGGEVVVEVGDGDYYFVFREGAVN